MITRRRFLATTGAATLAAIPLVVRAAELVRLKLDLLMTSSGEPAGFALKDATATIPIVMATSTDPVGTGLVASLPRPGGNITGLTLAGTDLSRSR